MSELRLREYAKRDLADIWGYIQLHSETNATNFVNHLRSVMQALADSPRIGRLRPELGTRIRSHPEGNYIILYRPTRVGIEVIRVLNGNRSINKAMLRKR